MEKHYETKIGRITEKCAGMDGAVISTIIRCGWEHIAGLSDDDIKSNVEENSFINAELPVSILKAAREICNTCDLWEDFLPYIRKHLTMVNCPSESATLYREDFSNGTWDILQRTFDEENVSQMEFRYNSFHAE